MPDQFHALDSDGEVVLKELLTPLFKTLGPGLEDRAEELRVEATAVGNSFEVSSSYRKEGSWLPLIVAEGFHPYVTCSRLRILSGMSIVHQPHQDGRMVISSGKKTIAVDIEITNDGRREVVLFRPRWELGSL